MKARAGTRRGKCENLSGCLLAYRGEMIEIGDGQPFVCTECGKPLLEIKPQRNPWIAFLIGLVVLGGIAVVGGGMLPKFGKEKQPLTHIPTSADLPPSETSTTITESDPAVAEPPPTVSAPAQIDLDIAKSENRKVKDEVLTRVDLMPITQAKKDQLYSSVERARQMGKVLTIPFGKGLVTLGAAEVQALKTELEKPELTKLRDEPTAVFVILGFADPKGDPKKNLQFSQQRADAVLATMRDKCGVFNVLHSVAMGGSTLLDAQNLEKNRIVEVWAVLP
jgi:outer membrane protein OmpA-like peptidoglycan-associated protein